MPSLKIMHDPHVLILTTSGSLCDATMEGENERQRMESLKLLHKEQFNTFCQTTYDKKVLSDLKVKKWSKIVSEEKATRIRAILRGNTIGASSNEKYCVHKTRKFRLFDRPELGLKDVLCLPARKQVC